MKKKKIKILHVAQAAGGVDRYIRMLLKYLDKEKFENILVCSQDFREKDYKNLVDSFEQVEMGRAIGSNDLKAIGTVRKLIKKYNPDIVYAYAESVKYFQKENDGKLPSLKSLKKRKEELTQEIAERKKAYAPLREESRRLEIASDNVYSIFRKTNEMKSDLAWKREWEANVRERARQEQARQEQRERQPKRKKRSYDMSL